MAYSILIFTKAWNNQTKFQSFLPFLTAGTAVIRLSGRKLPKLTFAFNWNCRYTMGKENGTVKFGN